jgi:hypothetical protein
LQRYSPRETLLGAGLLVAFELGEGAGEELVGEDGTLREPALLLGKRGRSKNGPTVANAHRSVLELMHDDVLAADTLASERW